MIIQHFTDNDLYKFTTMYAIQKLYPHARVKYQFFNRGEDNFPNGFAEALHKEVESMQSLVLNKEEEAFIRCKCYYFDPVFIDFLKGYRYDANEISINQQGGKLELVIEGYWYRTVLWEVPLMALISELFFKMTGEIPKDVQTNALYKGTELAKLKARFSDFGTRRRFSSEVHDEVVKALKESGGAWMKGSSNVYLSLKHGLTPIGTHPHEWFMYHAAHYGYRRANIEAMMAWTNVYKGSLGIALTDTFTTDNFFDSFELKYAKLFDGLRWDSGDAIEFTRKALQFYEKNRIDAKSKTIVYSDSLNIGKVKRIKAFVSDKISDAYGIGTYFTNDVGAKPLNMVIKLTQADTNQDGQYYPTVKLSDVQGKHTGDKQEIELCKKVLGIE